METTGLDERNHVTGNAVKYWFRLTGGGIFIIFKFGLYLQKGRGKSLNRRSCLEAHNLRVRLHYPISLNVGKVIKKKKTLEVRRK